jgi:hypothetical protein|tara:strand:+ start:538 stop:666 length:129 start_codon:yes stop_codon:yes gene_type:complete
MISENNREEIINELLKLKEQNIISVTDKLKIQKLQQLLDKNI